MKNKQILDKNGVPIEEFDVLKVYHFTGVRRKKYYMYKLAVLREGRLYGAHLSTKNPTAPGYPLWTKDYNSEDYEIVQSMNWKKLK